MRKGAAKGSLSKSRNTKLRHSSFTAPLVLNLRTRQAVRHAFEAGVFVGAVLCKNSVANLPANGMRRVFAIFEREPLAAPVVCDSLPVNPAAGFRCLSNPYLLSCYVCTSAFIIPCSISCGSKQIRKFGFFQKIKALQWIQW